MVPPSHGAWLAANVPGATTTFGPGEGHVSIVVDYQEAIFENIRSMVSAR